MMASLSVMLIAIFLSEYVTAVLIPGYIYTEFIHEKICFVLQVL